MDKIVRRGDLFYADLNPVRGSEQGGNRPILVIQNNTGNKHSPTIIAAMITSRPKKHHMPTHVGIGSSGGLPEDSMVMLEQIRTIDRTRLGGYIGCIDDDIMDYIDDALGISVGLKEEHPNEMNLCLCAVCVRQFYNSPDHQVRRVHAYQEAKDTCTYCDVRMGYDFIIKKRHRKGKQIGGTANA